MAQQPGFMKSTVSNNGGGRKKFDMVVQVQGFDLAKGVLKGLDAEGKELDVTISKFQKFTTSKGDFCGSTIDERLAKSFPTGCRAILEGCMEEPEADGRRQVSVNWILSAANDPNKTLEGLMTAKTFRGDVTGVMVWKPDAIAIDNENMLGRIASSMDDSVGRFNQRDADGKPINPVKPTMGILARLVNAESGEVVQITPPLHWDSTTEQPIGGAHLNQVIDWLKEECRERPGLVGEVCLFRRYRGSKEWTLDQEHPGPVGTMGRARCKSAPDVAQPDVVGGIYGGKGILKLSPGSYDSKLGRVVGAENDFANQLVISAAKGHIAELVTGPNGEARKVHPDLKMVFPERQAPQNQAQQEAGQEKDASQEKAAPAERAQAPQQEAAAPASQQQSPNPTEEKAAPRRPTAEFDFN